MGTASFAEFFRENVQFDWLKSRNRQLPDSQGLSAKSFGWDYINRGPPVCGGVSRCGLAVRRSACKQKDLGSIRLGSLFSSKMVVYGHCLVTLPTQLMKQ